VRTVLRTRAGFVPWIAVSGWLAAAILAVAWFHALIERAHLRVLPLGDLVLPAPPVRAFFALWAVWGTLAAVCAAIGFARAGALLDGHRHPSGEGSWLRRDAVWLAVLALLAFLVAVWVRSVLLRDTRITDDEPAYEFSARLLAEGRLHVPSPPHREFWQRVFFINDGRWYPEYWLGWPALLAIGVRLGAEGLVNPCLAAITLPPAYFAARRLGGGIAARVAGVLLVTSPMLALGNATKLSHTACLCALAWMLWCGMRSLGRDSHPAWSAGFALAFSVAFFTRPHTTVMHGLPVLVAWLVARFASESGRLRRWGAFAAPAALMAGLFLAANHALTGSAFYPPFVQIADLASGTGYLFSQLPPGTQGLPDLRFDPAQSAATLGAGLLRFNTELYGWPSSLVLACCAWGVRGTGLVWAMVGTTLAGLSFFWVAGVDTFGPTYWFELALPVSVLTGVGCVRVRDALRARADALGAAAPVLSRLPLALVASLVCVGAAGYAPVRLRTVARIVEAVRGPEAMVARHGIGHAVLFGMRPFSPCLALPARHFVFWPPGNDARLANDLLWANHLTVEHDRELLRSDFPTRKGYVYFWSRDCTFGLFDLDDPASDALPPNRELPPGWRPP
jgi:4-amino-4-deoxy-L-arabinose transferase-like glycosyltransferase